MQQADKESSQCRQPHTPKQKANALIGDLLYGDEVPVSSAGNADIRGGGINRETTVRDWRRRAIHSIRRCEDDDLSV